MGAARPQTPRWGYYPQTPFLCVDNSKPLQLALIGAAFVLGARHIESFDQTFSPRRARLHIAKAFRLRIALPERQYKSLRVKGRALVAHGLLAIHCAVERNLLA